MDTVGQVLDERLRRDRKQEGHANRRELVIAHHAAGLPHDLVVDDLGDLVVRRIEAVPQEDATESLDNSMRPQP